mmetsp:Transcript_27496/g.54962  ORF Transcript_27496/g.54962 Transcript_27496/m.54962 type:complete len:184 (-) Transcript_27496:143-694(-)
MTMTCCTSFILTFSLLLLGSKAFPVHTQRAATGVWPAVRSQTQISQTQIFCERAPITCSNRRGVFALLLPLITSFPSVAVAVTIDVNNSVAREFSALPGTFPTIASKIVKRGPYKSKREMYDKLDSDEERARLRAYDSSLKISPRDSGIMQFKNSQICKYECKGGGSAYQNDQMKQIQQQRRY